LQIFFGDGELKLCVVFAGLFEGGFGKSVDLMWCFCGELWWDVWQTWTVCQHFSAAEKWDTSFNFIFRGLQVRADGRERV
jgi:hypothetical protein